MINYQLVQDTIKEYIDKYVLQPTSLQPSQAKKLALQLGVSTVVVYYVFRIFIYNLYIHPLNRIPGPKISRRLPFLGNLPQILKEEECGALHKQWTKKYGGISVYHGPWNKPDILVSDSVLLKQILFSQEYDFVKSPESVEFLGRFLGNGLLIAEGDVHRRQRKILNPAFSVSSIRAMTPLMSKPCSILVEKWLDMANRNDDELVEIDILSGLSMATLDVIGMVLGQDFKSVEFAGTNEQSKLSQAYLHLFSSELSVMRILTFIFPILEYLPSERNRQEKQELKWLHEESLALVQAGIDRAAMEKATGIKSDRPRDLLDVMIELRDEDTNEGLTVEEMRAQCLTFLAAG
jgi:cytochrome P450